MNNISQGRFHRECGMFWSSHSCQGLFSSGVIAVLASAKNHYWDQEAILMPWCSLPKMDLLQLHFRMCNAHVDGNTLHRFGKSSLRWTLMLSHSIPYSSVYSLKTKLLWHALKSPWGSPVVLQIIGGYCIRIQQCKKTGSSCNWLYRMEKWEACQSHHISRKLQMRISRKSHPTSNFSMSRTAKKPCPGAIEACFESANEIVRVQGSWPMGRE